MCHFINKFNKTATWESCVLLIMFSTICIHSGGAWPIVERGQIEPFWIFLAMHQKNYEILSSICNNKRRFSSLNCT
jgi:hypothetical protein